MFLRGGQCDYCFWLKPTPCSQLALLRPASQTTGVGCTAPAHSCCVTLVQAAIDGMDGKELDGRALRSATVSSLPLVLLLVVLRMRRLLLLLFPRLLRLRRRPTRLRLPPPPLLRRRL